MSDPHFGGAPRSRRQLRGESARSLITFVSDRPGHDRRSAIDGTRIERELSFRLSVAQTAGLGATVHWFIDNEPWWRATMERSYRNWIVRQYGDRAATWSPAAARPGRRLWTDSH